mmetsp:Transcript_13007/g.33345  ORF Transcript_13007/g.33345 Transcript_13007/m.33345 type:complete len:311 (+) Transcript_13007:1-933(+)
MRTLPAPWSVPADLQLGEALRVLAVDAAAGLVSVKRIADRSTWHMPHRLLYSKRTSDVASVLGGSVADMPREARGLGPAPFVPKDAQQQNVYETLRTGMGDVMLLAPPGTGKSFVTAHAMSRRTLDAPGYQVWIVCETLTCVANWVELLQNDAVRGGVRIVANETVMTLSRLLQLSKRAKQIHPVKYANQYYEQNLSPFALAQGARGDVSKYQNAWACFSGGDVLVIDEALQVEHWFGAFFLELRRLCGGHVRFMCLGDASQLPPNETGASAYQHVQGFASADFKKLHPRLLVDSPLGDGADVLTLQCMV